MIIDDASIRVHIKSKPCSRATAVVSSTRTNAVARAASLPETAESSPDADAPLWPMSARSSGRV